jgi:hypothetical protein
MYSNGFRIAKGEVNKIIPNALPFLMKDSVTFKQGSAIKLASSTTVPGIDLADATGDNVFGIVIGFLTKNNLPPAIDTGGYGSGTLTETPAYDQFAADSDNVLTEKTCALVILTKGLILSGNLDAAIGTTTGSDLAGNYFDISTSDCSQLDEDTVSASKATYLSIPNGVGSNSPKDPAVMNTTRILVKVLESEEFQPQ